MKTPDPEKRRYRQAGGDDISAQLPKRVDDLDISTSEDGCVVSQAGRDKLHFLNPTAALILELCDGETTPEQLADLLKQAYGLPEPPVEDVRAALKQLKAEGLLL